MTYLRRTAILRLAVLPFVLTLWLSACFKWTEVETTVEASPEPLPSPTRVILVDARMLELENATITQDSLFGTLKGSGEMVRLAVEDVRRVETKEGSSAVAAIAIVGILGVVAIMVSSIELFPDGLLGSQ